MHGSNDALKRIQSIKNLGNPYAFLDAEGMPASESDPEAQLRAYYRKLENPCAYDSIFGVPGETAQLVTTGSGAQPCREEGQPATLRRITQEEFETNCRRIFQLYIPQSEGGRLRPQYREFILRNKRHSPEHRFLLLQELSRYDLATSGDFQPHFNREREPIVESKLRELEARVLAKLLQGG